LKISVIGLGFVGTVTAACLCELGHEVVGVDLDAGKVDLLSRGHAPILEPEIDQLVADVWRCGRLSAITDIAAAVARTDVTFVCIGTLRLADGSQDISAVEGVIQHIGKAIAGKAAFHSVVIRSTVLPGMTRGHVLKLLERETGGQAGEAFGLAINPEFTREGSAVADFRAPSRIVVGEIDALTADRLVSIYSGIDASVFRASAEAAELAKYADNSWHALKVVFANEIDAIARLAGVDGHDVMDIFCADDLLNISPAYLKPGFAFGGPCLPKDVETLTSWCQSNGLDIPVLAHITESNDHVIARVNADILREGCSRVAFLGLSFKAGVCDLRASPIVTLARRLIGAGLSVRAFDPDVSRGRSLTTGRDYTDDAFDDLGDLLVDDPDGLMDWGEMIVVASRADQYGSALSKIESRHAVIDLTTSRSRRFS